jgi:hypothetical protein
LHANRERDLGMLAVRHFDCGPVESLALYRIAFLSEVGHQGGQVARLAQGVMLIPSHFRPHPGPVLG